MGNCGLDLLYLLSIVGQLYCKLAQEDSRFGISVGRLIWVFLGV